MPQERHFASFLLHSVVILPLAFEMPSNLTGHMCGNTHMSSHLCPLFSPPYLITAPLPLLNTHLCTVLHDGRLNQVAALSRSLSVSTFSHCSVHWYGSKRFTSQQHSLPDNTALLNGPTSKTRSASHTHWFSELTNGRPGWRRATRIKGGRSDQPRAFRRSNLPVTY